MTVPKISDATILTHTSPQVFERGQKYVASGAVTDITQRGSRLTALVEGSHYEPYEVQIVLDAGGLTTTTCTCSYEGGGWCKHIVAVLLVCRNAPEQVRQRPPLDEILGPLDRDQLHHLVTTISRQFPSVVPFIESTIQHHQAVIVTPPHPPDVTQQRSPRHTTIDPQPFRNQAQSIMGAISEMRSGMDTYYYTSTAVDEIRNLVQQAEEFTHRGDGNNALLILEAITEEYVNTWFHLDDSDGEAGAYFGEIGEAWAEALLTADLTPDQRMQWAKRFETWQFEIEDYGVDEGFQIARLAALQGWDTPPIQRMLQGNVTTPPEPTREEEDEWDEEDKWDEEDDYRLTFIRLDILERQGRMQEFLNLAQSTRTISRYVVALAKTGQIQEAVEKGLNQFTMAKEALDLARALREGGDVSAALQIAEHGLTLTEPSLTELAIWLRDIARSRGNDELALRAAKIAFQSRPELPAFLAVQELAGDAWDTFRNELLDILRQSRTTLAQYKIDIFLHEGLIDDAIMVVNRGNPYYEIVDRVLEAAITQRPDWVIETGIKHAERTIEAKKAQYYHHAVNRLALVARAYQHKGDIAGWHDYLDDLKSRHGRKHKLMDLLRTIRI